MSILDRLSSNAHLSDTALADLWSAAKTGERSPRNQHLAACPRCRARYAEYDSWLEDLREEALSEADEAFPPDRLAAQQAQILRRLEALERPARVIAFPRFSRPGGATRGASQRWIAAAAAAGLFVGLAAGQILDLRHRFDQPDRRSEARLSRNAPARSGVQPAVHTGPTDEALLYDELGVSTRTVYVSALEAIDEYTPRARDMELPR